LLHCFEVTNASLEHLGINTGAFCSFLSGIGMWFGTAVTLL